MTDREKNMCRAFLSLGAVLGCGIGAGLARLVYLIDKFWL